MRPIITSILLLLITPAFAYNLNDPIPIDKKLTHGKLANGLTYYILPNKKPLQKAELRLVVKAGSLNENNNQRGLAHFLEHMAFNGSEHFPKQALIDHLQRMGVKFGSDLNAYTSSNETVYILPIPLNQAENLNTGLQVLEDWAFHLNLDASEIDQERNVVFEEWRIDSQNPSTSTQEKNRSLIYKNSLYAERNPIGDMETIRNAKPELLREFYKTWYRPSLMSVIVVGDVDVTKTRALIETHFGKQKNPAIMPKLPSDQIPNNKEPLIGVFAHKDLPQASVLLTHKDFDDSPKEQTVASYSQNLKYQLITLMINERLNALQDQPNQPFIKAFSWYGFLGGEGRSKRAYSIDAQAVSGREKDALNLLHLENQRIAQHGFTQDEFNRAIDTILTNVDTLYNNRDKVESSDKAEEYIRATVEHEALPSIAWEKEMTHKQLTQLKLTDINSLVQSYLGSDNRIVLINTNKTPSHISEEDILNIINSTPKTQTPISTQNRTSLLKSTPTAGKITNTQYNKTLGTTTWQLSNGARVTFKTTDFNNDSVSFSSYSDGGSSLISDDVWLKTQWSYEALSEAGFNGFSKTELAHLYNGHIVNISTQMNEDSQGLSGEFALKDSKLAFETIYSQITGLNHDPAAFERAVQRGINSTQNLKRDRMTAFIDYVYRQINHKNPRFTGTYPDTKAWQQQDYEATYQNYKKSFENANGMHFTFVGKIKPETLKPLVEMYLASLPSNLNEKPTYKDLGYRSDLNGQKIELKKGSENLSIVFLGLNGEAPFNEHDALSFKALADILTIKLTERLRETDGGVYSINAFAEMHARPYGKYTFNIIFPCDPQKVDALIQRAQAELNALIQDGPTMIDLEKFKKGTLTSLREQIKTNAYWVSALQTAYKRGTDPIQVLDEEARINQLTSADIQAIGKKYLSKPLTQAVLKPE